MDPFKFEDNLQNVCFDGLTARSIPHGTTRQDSSALPAERVEVVARGFSRASGKMAQSASGVWFDSHYSGTLAFGVITQRGGSNAANHNVWVSNIRTMMCRATQFLTTNNLPCYTVLRVVETASDSEEVPKTDADHTPITYAIDLEIVGTQVP